MVVVWLTSISLISDLEMLEMEGMLLLVVPSGAMPGVDREPMGAVDPPIRVSLPLALHRSVHHCKEERG